jgi:FkbM family methyltransferase
MEDTARSIFNIKELYDSLSDDESKEIFKYRMSFFLDDNIKDLFRMVTLSKKTSGENDPTSIEQTFDEFIVDYNDYDKNNLTLVIYGIGSVAEEIYDALNDVKIRVDYFCDYPVTKSEFKKIKVLDPSLLRDLKKPLKIIVAPNASELRSMKNLIKSGIKQNEIITLWKREPVYFGRPGLSVQDDEIFIDAGAHDGDTILSFIKWCNGKYKKIIAFEPDAENQKKVERTLSDNGIRNVVLENCGLWDENERIGFDNQGTSSSKIDVNSTSKINVCRLDDVIDEKVTFIKMDIEGAELKALKGSAETIRKYKPKLAICIYHKNEDFFEIPYFVHSLVPEYKLYLRHHSWSIYETVLYAFL